MTCCRYEDRKGIKFYATEGLVEVYDLRMVTSTPGIFCVDSPATLLFVDYQTNPLKMKWLDCSKIPPRVIAASSLHESWVKDTCVAKEENGNKKLVGPFIKLAHKIQAVNVQLDQIEWSFDESMRGMKEKLQPRGVTADDQGHVFVCDEANACIQLFSVSNGSYSGTLLKMGRKGRGMPRGIACCKNSKWLAVGYTKLRSVTVCFVKLS